MTLAYRDKIAPDIEEALLQIRSGENGVVIESITERSTVFRCKISAPKSTPASPGSAIETLTTQPLLSRTDGILERQITEEGDKITCWLVIKKENPSDTTDGHDEPHPRYTDSDAAPAAPLDPYRGSQTGCSGSEEATQDHGDTFTETSRTSLADDMPSEEDGLRHALEYGGSGVEITLFDTDGSAIYDGTVRDVNESGGDVLPAAIEIGTMFVEDTVTDRCWDVSVSLTMPSGVSRPVIRWHPLSVCLRSITELDGPEVRDE